MHGCDSENRKARLDYEVIETIEAGIVLTGSEVKSLRERRANIDDAFARFVNNELFLHNAHISEYPNATHFNHDPKAPRKLLLHRSELRRLAGYLQQKGYTLVPLSLYWKNGLVKVELALARGRKQFDKRQVIKQRELDRQLKRALMHRLRRG